MTNGLRTGGWPSRRQSTRRLVLAIGQRLPLINNLSHTHTYRNDVICTSIIEYRLIIYQRKLHGHWKCIKVIETAVVERPPPNLPLGSC